MSFLVVPDDEMKKTFESGEKHGKIINNYNFPKKERERERQKNFNHNFHSGNVHFSSRSYAMVVMRWLKSSKRGNERKSHSRSRVSERREREKHAQKSECIIQN